MTQVIQGATTPSPEDSGGPKYKLIRSSDLDRTDRQITLLCSVLAEARQLVWVRNGFDEQAEVDPRVREAAAKTYEDASLQIRNLVNEQPRWSPEDPETSGFVEQLARSNRELVILQKKHLAEKLRPFSLLGGCLRRIEYQGQPGWLAAVGKEPDPAGLFGIGSTPQEAVEAFDEAYTTSAVKELAKAASGDVPAEKKKTRRSSKKPQQPTKKDPQ